MDESDRCLYLLKGDYYFPFLYYYIAQIVFFFLIVADIRTEIVSLSLESFNGEHNNVVTNLFVFV